MIKTSTILKEGLDNKVLVLWKTDKNDVEYSIHTKGLSHTDENHDLLWGQYYGDNQKMANDDFQYYVEGSNLRTIIKNINDTVESWENHEDCWIEHDERYEILSICNGNEDDVYTFQGDGYRQLVSDYERSCVSNYVNFTDYIIYDSQNW